MSLPPFPFATRTPNQMSVQERDESYQRLAAWPEPTFQHSSGLQMVWGYDDARQILSTSHDGLSNANSLDPLIGYGRIMRNAKAVRHFMKHLVPLPAKATANLTDDVLHDLVWRTMAGPDGYFTIRSEDRNAQASAMREHFYRSLLNADYAAHKGEPLDLTRLSIDYATNITSERIGLRPDTWKQVAEWSGAQSGLLGQWMQGEELAVAVEALGQLFTTSSEAMRHPHPRGFAEHLQKHKDIPRRVAVSILANSLAAGVHTVAGSIQQTSERLLSDPNRTWWGMLDDPGNVPRIAAKGLQLDPGLVAWKRKATEEVTLRSGTALKKGQLLVMFAAANRDPAAFPDPLHLRNSEERTKLPLTFGYGKHVCPGRQIAHLAMEVFLKELHTVAPGLILAADTPRPTTRKHDLLFSGADVTACIA